MAKPVRITIPVPFAIGTVNAWLMPGTRPALLDCGIGTQEAYQTLHDAIRGANVDPDALTLHITHGHVDHAGNAARLAKDHGVPLVAPRIEAPFVETFRRDAEARNDAYADALRLHGMPEERVLDLRAKSGAIDDHLDDTQIGTDVEEGQRLLWGDLEVQALRTPGHTPGSTCFFADDLIFTGDTLLEHITSNALELRDEDRGHQHQYVQTIDGMRRFVGCTALPGHHDPFVITDAVLDHHLDRHARRARRILDALDRPRTAWEILPRIFAHIGPDQQFMAMAEIVGHLHALEIDGKVARSKTDGVRRFRRR